MTEISFSLCKEYLLERTDQIFAGGGSYKEWRPTSTDENLELDGSTSFVDEVQLSDDINITWLCRRPSQRNLVDEIKTWDDVLTLQTGKSFLHKSVL